jgi:hypothetical protein
VNEFDLIFFSRMASERNCQYITPKKGRRCRMMTKPGQSYCGEHAIFDPNNSVG